MATALPEYRNCQHIMIFHDLFVIEDQMSRATLFDHWTPPEKEPPLIIEDKKYTTEPIIDENILAQCILELAQATRDALDIDFDQNNRYCRRIRLDHLNEHGEREELQVLLPYEAFCWNSYDTEDIVVLMLEAIRGIDYQNIVWYQVRALLDDFMDPLVYRFIEVLEKSESADDIDFAKVEEKFRRAQLLNGQNPQQPKQIQKPTPAEPTAVSSELTRPTDTSDVAQAPQKQFKTKMYGSQAPIDVHCGKLVDWLVQRRHCKKDWGENLSNIRRKIKVALKDMPESEDIRLLLTGSKLDYFKSKRIVEILRTTEADTKNIFGYYSSQRMKDWQDIVYSYERDYVYLAELATDLIRETNYEIPGIKKVIQRLNKEKNDAEKDKANQLRRALQFNSEYQRLAQTYGIKGINVIDELHEQSKNLDSVMDEILNLAKQLDGGLEFYRDFAKSNTQQDASQFLPILDYVIKKGNTTVYEWKNGEAPERIIVEESAPNSVGNSNPSEIELVNDEIDFGDDLPETNSSESSSGFVHVGNNDDTFVKVDEVCDTGDKVARGEDAKLVLESRKSRNQFLNNLFELEAFYKQLASEGQLDTSRMGVSDMNKITNTIRQIVDIANKEKNRVLFQMSDSPSFIESVNERFALKTKQASDCSIRAELIDEKIRGLVDQIRETEVHLKRSVSASKELQKRVEACISELYSGRTINIMGC